MEENVLWIKGDRNQVKISEKKPIAVLDSIPVAFDTRPGIDHTVKQGETLYSIAKGNQVEVVDILAWNGLTITDGLKPGQVLKLHDSSKSIDPEKPESQPVAQANLVVPVAEQVHEVQATDTLYSVAKKYGVTIKDLMNWNEKTDLSLTVGEKLRIMQR